MSMSEPEPDPRIARTYAVVLGAATRLLSEEGSAGFTMDAVAARSGVAKTTIYRHWPSKDDLLMAALGCFLEDRDVPDTGTVRGDLLALLTTLASELAEADWSKSLPAALERAEHDPEIAARHLAIVRHRSDPCRRIVTGAQERGELRADIDPELLVAVFGGALFYRRLMTRQATSPEQVEALLDGVLAGLHPPASQAT
jgi:AcrR family transcriptional regulator